MNAFKEPYYLVDFNSSICNFEIYVNDMPAFIHQDGGSIASHYPINHLILKSGKQNLKIKMLPLKSEEVLRKDSFLKIKIHFYDSSTNNYNDIIQVFKFESPDFEEKEYSLINLEEATFNAEVPYKITGWENSKIIKKDKNLKNEVISFYKKVYQFAKNEDINSIFEMMKTKFDEVDKAMFLNDTDNKKELSDLFATIKSDGMILEEFPQTERILFLGNGKVINLVRENNEAVIHYVNKETNEEYSFPFLIHKKEESSNFEIIR